MTALLGLFSLEAARDEGLIHRLFAGMTKESGVRLERCQPAEETMLGVATLSWDTASGVRLASDGRFTVIADATLYYRDDLRRKLSDAGAGAPEGGSAAEWILAATRAWGEEAIQRLEGDFAYVVWDEREKRLFAARDYAGSRPLFFARIGSGLAVASSMRALRRIPGCPDTLNLVAIIEDAASLDVPYPNETAYSAIQRLPGGLSLRWRLGESPRVSRWWEIPIFDSGVGAPFEQAAEELRELIAQAVLERTDLARGTSVFLSGGYDSTAVYGAGQHILHGHILHGQGNTPRLGAISLSHPAGDPGREDELILTTTGRWGAQPTWIDSERIPGILDPEWSAARRDEPLSHPYELWNRALADTCRETGDRVALNGSGGDAWFSVSPLFLADLLRQGRWLELRREWKLLIGRRITWYNFFKTAVQPNLSPGAHRLIAMLRGGRPLRDSLDRPIPAWVRPDFVARTDLRARRSARPPRRRGESLSGAEHAYFVQTAFTERITALLFAYNLESGVELRSPLLDSRIVRFAAQRPRWESNSGYQNKRLLRASMRGVLPDEIIAPRKSRTGLPTTYFWRTVEDHARWARDRFADGILLAEVGVVDHKRLLSSLDVFLAGQVEDIEEVAAISFVIQAELWLRSELGEEQERR